MRLERILERFYEKERVKTSTIAFKASVIRESPKYLRSVWTIVSVCMYVYLCMNVCVRLCLFVYKPTNTRGCNRKQDLKIINQVQITERKLKSTRSSQFLCEELLLENETGKRA